MGLRQIHLPSMALQHPLASALPMGTAAPEMPALPIGTLVPGTSALLSGMVHLHCPWARCLPRDLCITNVYSVPQDLCATHGHSNPGDVWLPMGMASPRTSACPWAWHTRLSLAVLSEMIGSTRRRYFVNV